MLAVQVPGFRAKKQQKRIRKIIKKNFGKVTAFF